MLYTENELKNIIANDVKDAWAGAGFYEIKFSDGGQAWTSNGPIFLEDAEDLADELAAAYECATETHLPYAEEIDEQVYTTKSDLIDNEIEPALGEHFDEFKAADVLDNIIDEVYVFTSRGYIERPNVDFWEIVEKYDRANA